MYPDKFIKELDEEMIDELREITEKHDQDLIQLSSSAEFALNQALGCRFEMLQGQYYRHCIYILASERIRNRKKLQQLRDEVETLTKEVQEQRKIIDTYNGSYLQRVKVKNGVKIARKSAITKEAIQQLQNQGLTIEQIAKKLGCGRTTIWRRLNEQVN